MTDTDRQVLRPDMTPLSVLRDSTFGKRTAEEERESLKRYFVETEQWRRVFQGEVDVVYGPKGSGKSAIYSLIIESDGDLIDRNIIPIAGENPQGAPAFQSLGEDPPSGEFEFVSLWKLYVLTLCGQAIKEYGIATENCRAVVDRLEDAELLPAAFNLSKALTYAFNYVKKLTRRLSSIETEISIDPSSGLPTGLRGKISLLEPSVSQSRLGVVSIDQLFRDTESALDKAGYTLWILLDRLDVAFADKPDLETDALRALFKFYLDTKNFRRIRTKIFLRTDIWSKIAEKGFREASHIERALIITWRNEDITNLIVKRALSNERICNYFDCVREDVISDFRKQEEFMYRMFPPQVDSGPNKPSTFAWIISRTRDSVQSAAPREVIHFLNELRDVQVARFERGEKLPPERRLFEQISFKEALPPVSRARLEQTVYAEYPRLKIYIEQFREKKATHTTLSLASLWGTDEANALSVASELEKVGFFERMGGSSSPTWRVPFLYRPALDLIQGAAEA